MAVQGYEIRPVNISLVDKSDKPALSSPVRDKQDVIFFGHGKHVSYLDENYPIVNDDDLSVSQPARFHKNIGFGDHSGHDRHAPLTIFNLDALPGQRIKDGHFPERTVGPKVAYSPALEPVQLPWELAIPGALITAGTLSLWGSNRLRKIDNKWAKRGSILLGGTGAVEIGLATVACGTSPRTAETAPVAVEVLTVQSVENAVNTWNDFHITDGVQDFHLNRTGDISSSVDKGKIVTAPFALKGKDGWVYTLASSTLLTVDINGDTGAKGVGTLTIPSHFLVAHDPKTGENATYYLQPQTLENITHYTALKINEDDFGVKAGFQFVHTQDENGDVFSIWEDGAPSPVQTPIIEQNVDTFVNISFKPVNNIFPTPWVEVAATAVPVLSLEQQAKLAEVNQKFTGSFVVSEDGGIKNIEGTDIAGITYDVESGMILLQLDNEKVSLQPSQMSVNADRAVHIIGYEQNADTNEWKEIMKFPVRQIENFRECKITEDDILSGRIDRWLETLSKPFDLSKINLDAKLVWYEGWQEIMYNVDTSPNFSIDGSEPFHRDIVACYLQVERDGKTYDYIFMPVEFYDKATGKNWWVKLVVPLYDPQYNYDKTSDEFYITTWRNDMKISIIVTANSIPMWNQVDPLVASTFEKYSSDLDSRFSKFADGSDMSVLSNTDMVFLTDIVSGLEEWSK